MMHGDENGFGKLNENGFGKFEGHYSENQDTQVT